MPSIDLDGAIVLGENVFSGRIYPEVGKWRDELIGFRLYGEAELVVLFGFCEPVSPIVSKIDIQRCAIERVDGETGNYRPGGILWILIGLRICLIGVIALHQKQIGRRA